MNAFSVHWCIIWIHDRILANALPLFVQVPPHLSMSTPVKGQSWLQEQVLQNHRFDGSPMNWVTVQSRRSQKILTPGILYIILTVFDLICPWYGYLPFSFLRPATSVANTRVPCSSSVDWVIGRYGGLERNEQLHHPKGDCIWSSYWLGWWFGRNHRIRQWSNHFSVGSKLLVGDQQICWQLIFRHNGGTVADTCAR